ncbi:MAG: GAF domain-containing protein [Candidatus Omnitrophica bacterium]|nr:GAF domain-containing protein [Candidatus Omnitrophota bacterium]
MAKKKASKKELPFKNLVALAAYLSFGEELKDDELLRLIMEIGVGMMSADEGSLLLLDKKRQELEFMITIGEHEVQQRLKGQRFSMHKGITGLAASTGEPQTGAPTYHGVKQADYKKKHPNEPEAVLAAPMLVEGEVIGVITAVSFKKGRFFSSQDVKLYSRFSQLCGMVIRQRRREEVVRNMLLGKKGGVKFLKPSDKAAVDIARNLGNLSQKRKDLMPLCADLVEIIGRIAGELRWKGSL